MIQERAPAKINLYLHVGPVRGDGLHEIQSLFVFTEDGDMVTAEDAPDFSLKVGGPFAGAIADLPAQENLVLKAATLLRDELGVANSAAIVLEKNLPVAAGIGGGSADAAAALRALSKLWRLDIDEQALAALAFRLGADVPACLSGAPVHVSGAGEELAPGPLLPPIWACLVNPRIEMPTGPIFRDFDAVHSSPILPPLPIMDETSHAALAAFIENTGNDLQPLAERRAPVIAEIVAMLAGADGALAARMSGSGATCFGLFETKAAAHNAAEAAQRQGWWAMASPLIVG